jgi:hypothetical protein
MSTPWEGGHPHRGGRAGGACPEAVTAREPEFRAEPTQSADPAGNQRLTATSGSVLLVLFVAGCLTLLKPERLPIGPIAPRVVPAVGERPAHWGGSGSLIP